MLVYQKLRFVANTFWTKIPQNSQFVNSSSRAVQWCLALLSRHCKAARAAPVATDRQWSRRVGQARHCRRGTGRGATEVACRACCMTVHAVAFYTHVGVDDRQQKRYFFHMETPL